MSISKLVKRTVKSNRHYKLNEYREKLDRYDHFIALDWSIKTMAVARLTKKTKSPKIIESPSDVVVLQEYLKNLNGKKILTIEETTSTHWLYVELYDYVDRIVICDPFKNRLLTDGPKNDKIDASKLCELLKGGFVREVYHTTERSYRYRKLERAYTQVVRAGVCLYNQKSSVYRSLGKSYRDEEDIDDPTALFILDHINADIKRYKEKKKMYEQIFEQECTTNKVLKNLCQLPGLGPIIAFRIYSIVVDVRRFPRAGKYLAYCGLVKHTKESGSVYYGKRKARYNRALKDAYKTAAIVAIQNQNPMREYYDYLRENGVAEHNARQAVARYLARVSFGMMKNETPYEPYRWRH
jgi:transposase